MSTNRYIYYNPNPDGNRIDDCAVRAICKATGSSWDYVHSMLCAISNEHHLMQNSKAVIGIYLRMIGHHRHVVEDSEHMVYTVNDFCRNNPEGVFILATEDHLVCIEDGFYYDTWNCGDEVVIFYWKR